MRTFQAAQLIFMFAVAVLLFGGRAVYRVRSRARNFHSGTPPHWQRTDWRPGAAFLIAGVAGVKLMAESELQGGVGLLGLVLLAIAVGGLMTRWR